MNNTTDKKADVASSELKTDEQKKPAAKKPVKKTAKLNPKAVIYLGPSVPGTGLERYKVFKGELNSNIIELTNKIPAIKRLIVDTKELANVEQKIGDKTTVFAHAFAEIINHIKKGDQR